jgi:predicted RNA-binding Zn-ribbon protein involved in translation (DUF1610 family)
MEKFICPQCGQRGVEVIRYDHAWEWSDNIADLGLKEDEPVTVYHCEFCGEDLLIETGTDSE